MAFTSGSILRSSRRASFPPFLPGPYAVFRRQHLKHVYVFFKIFLCTAEDFRCRAVEIRGIPFLIAFEYRLRQGIRQFPESLFAASQLCLSTVAVMFCPCTF